MTILGLFDGLITSVLVGAATWCGCAVVEWIMSEEE